MPGSHYIELSEVPTGGRKRFDFLSQGFEHLPDVGDDAVTSGGNTDGVVRALSGDRMITLTYALPVDTPDANPLVLPLLRLALSRS